MHVVRRAGLLGIFAMLAPSVAAAEAPIIGGSNVPAGKWPDVAAIYDSTGEQGCTGTLIAPTIVLTAEHCLDVTPSSVLVGATSLARQSEGDVIAVDDHIAYPNGFRSYDVGVLILAQASRFEPRSIASGWASVDIKDGAMAAIVGYGAIDRSSTMYIDELQEAMVPITDADCSSSAGCNSLAKPAGELGAGGMGTDTCEGDSGGPLYITSELGTFLAGVTSRGYDDNQFSCSEGGIYARPDKIVRWIEEQAGVPIRRGPEPEVGELSTVRGGAAETRIEPNDPKGERHTFAIVVQPEYGEARIREDGTLRVCTDADVAGVDQLTVTITDADNPARVLSLQLPVEIRDGMPESCDFDDFDGGCCSAGRGANSSLLLGVAVFVITCRKRRRR